VSATAASTKRDDSTVLDLPLYQVYGMRAGTVLMLLNGAKVVLMSPNSNPAESLASSRSKEAPLAFVGVSTTYLDQLRACCIDPLRPVDGARELSHAFARTSATRVERAGAASA